MKVLSYIRDDYKYNLGGDSIQFIKTMEYLKKKGIHIKVSHNLNENLRPYDIIHLFNIINIYDTYQFYKRAKAYKKKIILTPIYWNYGKYLHNNLKQAKYLKQWEIGNVLRKEVIQNSDLILPSSRLELDMIQKEFKIKKPYKIIYNGVDSSFLLGSPEKFFNKYKIKDERFVLTVGRICPHKNQLTLSKVCRELNVPFVMIGPINDRKYFNKCKEINPSLLHINRLHHDELSSAYSAAKVHCLVSWYETPGLANLEAGIAGCNILTTPEGSTKEYFKDYVRYALWDEYHKILENVSILLNQKKDDGLKNYIRDNFLWDNIADAVAQAYKEVMV